MCEHCADEALYLGGGNDVQRFRAAKHGGAGEQPWKAKRVIAVDMGDEDGAQLHNRVAGAKQLVLCAFTAVDQIPGFGAGVA